MKFFDKMKFCHIQRNCFNCWVCSNCWMCNEIASIDLKIKLYVEQKYWSWIFPAYHFSTILAARTISWKKCEYVNI